MKRTLIFSKRLTVEQGVAIIPISFFYSNGVSNAKNISMYFAKIEVTFQQGAGRLSDICI
jgi:hypothetical protein